MQFAPSFGHDVLKNRKQARVARLVGPPVMTRPIMCQENQIGATRRNLIDSIAPTVSPFVIRRMEKSEPLVTKPVESRVPGAFEIVQRGNLPSICLRDGVVETSSGKYNKRIYRS
jgi:hypothetical protein